jgi:glycosyltransferase involved in cell wall biosynthesis
MPDRPAVAILLSAYNGAPFLPEQLASLLAQDTAAWSLFWRDDGSSDDSPDILRRFGQDHPGRCREVGNGERLGVTGSFMALLRAAHAEGAEAAAFSDQDDVWLPHKVSRALAALAEVPDGVPALYCARQILTDPRLNRLGLSFSLRRPPGFPAALTQNIATGCTVVLNRAAMTLIAGSVAPGCTLHDWWCYLVVAAAGGRLIGDDEPVVLYRQHPGNLVGAPRTRSHRALAAARRGPGLFMTVLRGHVAGLLDQPQLLSPQAAQILRTLAAGLRGGPAARWRALRLAGLHRQTWGETQVFRVWFLVG